jgi:hypothetical protein
MCVKLFIFGLWTDGKIGIMCEDMCRVKYVNLRGIQKECWRLYSEVYIDGTARPRGQVKKDVSSTIGNQFKAIVFPTGIGSSM